MADRPNILIIYPDELRADAMGCAGNPCIKTPFFDRLAMEGVRFENAFTSFPLCTPFRASLFTGKYTHATGVYANHYPIPLGQQFLAEILREQGYRTGYIGKWHLDGGDKPGFVPPGPRRLGFDHMIGFNRGHFYLRSIYYRDTPQPYHCPRYEPDFQTDHLLEFLDSCLQRQDKSPFLAMICYGAPHFPLNMPEYYRRLYSPREVPVGPTVGDRKAQERVRNMLLQRNFPLASGVWGSDAETEKGFETEEEVRNFLAQYYGMISSVDHNVGVILNWLDRKGMAEDTVVILVSDHGDMAGEHGYTCRTKKTPYRTAMQVPLLVRYPRRLPAGRVVSSLVDASLDTMPTLLDLCGVRIPEGVHGVNYLPLMEGSSPATREAVFYEILKEKDGPERFPVPERGVRTQDWLYCRREEAPTLLIDLRNDPEERHNLIGDAAHSQVIQMLDGLLSEHMTKTRDDWAIEASFPPLGFLTHEEGEEKMASLLQKAIVEK